MYPAGGQAPGKSGLTRELGALVLFPISACKEEAWLQWMEDGGVCAGGMGGGRKQGRRLGLPALWDSMEGCGQGCVPTVSLLQLQPLAG